MVVLVSGKGNCGGKCTWIGPDTFTGRLMALPLHPVGYRCFFPCMKNGVADSLQYRSMDFISYTKQKKRAYVFLLSTMQMSPQKVVVEEQGPQNTTVKERLGFPDDPSLVENIEKNGRGVQPPAERRQLLLFRVIEQMPQSQVHVDRKGQYRYCSEDIELPPRVSCDVPIGNGKRSNNTVVKSRRWVQQVIIPYQCVPVAHTVKNSNGSNSIPIPLV